MTGKSAVSVLEALADAIPVPPARETLFDRV